MLNQGKGVISRTVAWSIVTGLVVVVLIVDGIITSLPFYDLESHRSIGLHILFSIEVLICALCQIIYMRIIRKKYRENTAIGHFRKYADITYLAVSITQYLIITLLILTVLEIETLNQYHATLVLISILLSLSLSAALSAALAFRFLLWIKHKKDILVIVYAAAAISIAMNSISLALFMSLEMEGKPILIDPSFFWTNTEVINYDIHQLQSNFALASFVSLWIASTFLLARHRRKWRSPKFYVIIVIPLVYYLGVLQFALSTELMRYGILNFFQGYTFNVLNSILTKPVGGMLFGIAFWMIGRGITDKSISDYMKLSAIGIMLLFISNEDAGLYLLPYPPFGLPTVTFASISSYMLFIGIYYTSISVSMNSELRKTIEKSVEDQFRFVSKIGRSQMEHEIESRVKGIARRSAKTLEDNAGIEGSLQDEDMEEYIRLVVKEKERMLERTGLTDINNDKNDNQNVSSQ
jgi:hypothetical protein